MILFDKIYDAESIVDVEQDVYDAIFYSGIPIDEHGFHLGEFKVTIEWKNTDD